MIIQTLLTWFELILAKYPLSVGAVVAIFGGFLFELLKMVYWTISEKNDSWSGTWDLFIYDACGKPEKHDQWDLRQRGKTIVGNIKRLEPATQNHRRYRCIGRVIGSDFIGVFWAKSQSVASYGCWFMSLTSTDFLLSGYYMRPNIAGKDVGPIKMTLEKRAPESTNWPSLKRKPRLAVSENLAAEASARPVNPTGIPTDSD
jgi:hypothetical protein